MPRLFGQDLSRLQLEERMGGLSQVAGVRLVQLQDGLERGIRMLEFRTGSGLRFTVLVDRAMDIGDCEYRGLAMGWHSPSGFRHPSLHEYEGEEGLAWARSFSGLMVTCGLDHILFGNHVPADNYVYDPRKAIRHSLHGRVSTIPARLVGYGESWQQDRCVLWAEGLVQQAAVFGEDLHLLRRIEAELGSCEFRIMDRIVNHGFCRTPHMYCYHINLGFPLLDDGARVVAPIGDVVWASHAGDNYRRQGVGYQRMCSPQRNFHEQVWQHELVADPDDHVSVALLNDQRALGFELITRKSQFPCLYEWQNLQAGQYAVAFEPSTNHVTGNLAARERCEMIWLEHGEECCYDSTFRVLIDADSMRCAESRIRSIAVQPEEDFPNPSGDFVALRPRP